MGDGSTSTLAATKLRPPSLPARLVDRDRLSVVLDEADDAGVALVLVSAPAGSGKSTLVAGWAATRSAHVAWLQLDEADADPSRFWVSVTSAIGRVVPEAAEHLAPLVAGSLGAGHVVVPAMVNELAALDQRLVLVLDDYHLVDELEVHRHVERLLDLCPPQLMLVLVTRADPPFRLGRLRVRGRIREVRAADLRFAVSEAAALLGPAAARLDAQRLDELCERTEGWAAGLVLAGLSMERSVDPARFVQMFRGDDQLVAGYLADELLDTLDPDDRRRLVEAAVLHRLSGPLLDAVTGSPDGSRWLDELATRNQLVIRLDSVGEWYRYHHLFRDLLLLEARRSIPERLPELHRRAAAWFETHGHPAAAVDHLLAAGDRDRAMWLMRVVGPDLLGSGRLRTLRNILATMSAGGELDAICMLLAGWDHYLTGRYGEARRLLDRATTTLPDDVDHIRTMPLRVNLAIGEGDVAAALAGARDVLADHELPDLASELTTAIGAAFVWAGLDDEARRVLTVALDRTMAEHRITAHAMALVSMTVSAFHGGVGVEACAAATRALDFAATSGLGEYHGIAPALAVRAVTCPGTDAVADAERAVVLARRATTRLGLVFVLALAGDVLLSHGHATGADVLAEAARTSAQCADPGIDGPLLDRIAARHRLAPPRPAPTTDLVEELTERELAVLRYLPSELSLPAIARELYVSPNTVKTQCSAIYRKLAVSSRQGAVQAARERRLL